MSMSTLDKTIEIATDPQAELPIGVFYSDELGDVEYAPAPPQNKRGYVCLFAQLSKVHHGTSLAFDAENIGC